MTEIVTHSPSFLHLQFSVFRHTHTLDRCYLTGHIIYLFIYLFIEINHKEPVAATNMLQNTELSAIYGNQKRDLSLQHEQPMPMLPSLLCRCKPTAHCNKSCEHADLVKML